MPTDIITPLIASVTRLTTWLLPALAVGMWLLLVWQVRRLRAN